MKIIDCEFHYYLPELMDYLSTRDKAMRYYPETKVLEVREQVYAHFGGVTNTYPFIDEMMNFGAERVAEMDRNGIDVGVMSSSPAVEELPEKESVYFAKKSNDAVAELIKKFPGRFLGTAILPTPYVDEAIKELERCVKELGFKYWHTHSNYMHEHLYDEKYLPLLGLDTMKTSLRLILNGTFDKFPKLRMILGHLGEFFPFIIDRVDNRFAWIRDDEVKMKHTVAYYFKNKNVVVTTSGVMSKISFECTKQAFGIDSIIFASDYPYVCLADMMKFVKTLDLTEEEKEKLFHLNAEKYIL